MIGVERNTTQGFAKGRIIMAGLSQWQEQHADIQFQNENLILKVDSKVQGIVPDLICCLDTQSESCHPDLQWCRAFDGVMLPTSGKGKSLIRIGKHLCGTWTALPHTCGLPSQMLADSCLNACIVQQPQRYCTSIIAMYCEHGFI